MKVAIIQHAPVYLDKKASLDKAVDLLEKAAQREANLAVFGETWLSGYPAWLDHCPGAALWGHQPTKEVFAKTYENAIDVNGPEVAAICRRAAELKMGICIGLNEKSGTGMANGTLYNSMLIIGTSGLIEVHHRKLMPTFTEKLVYGAGDGYGLRSATISGARVGGLICWEHWMPLARQAMHQTGEQVHIALWPAVNDLHQLASRHYAFEGRCFVIAAGQILKAGDLPAGLELPEHLKSAPESFVLNGGSCIIGPDGLFVSDPVFDQESLIVATLSLESTIKEKMTLDVTGHYARNDVFDLRIETKRNQ